MNALQALTLTQLAGKYNELAPIVGVPTVKRFADKESAVRRITELMNKVPAEKAPVERKRAVKLDYPLRRHIRPLTALDNLLGRFFNALVESPKTLAELDTIVVGLDNSKGKVPFNVRERTLKTARRLSRRGYGVRLVDGKVYIKTQE